MSSPAGRADLHLHTFHSDGTFSPEELVERAQGLGLRAIAVTDHDTVAALPAARKAAGAGLEVIAGVELTAAFKEREIHLLGYWLRIEEPALLGFLSRMREYRLDRIRAMIARLRAHGVAQISLEEVQAIAGPGTVGRPHLAEALVNRRAVPTIQQAFDRYLGDQAPCFVKGSTLTVERAVQILRAAGGVAVLAHPHRIIEDGWIPELVSAGIQGIEVYHSEQEPQVTRHYLELAHRHRLLVSGGSDCHGFRKSQGPLIGSVTVPYALVERLKEAVGNLPPATDDP